jgi:hypothetical protein
MAASVSSVETSSMRSLHTGQDGYAALTLSAGPVACG